MKLCCLFVLSLVLFGLCFSCSHVFQPKGSGAVPVLGGLRGQLKGHVYYLAEEVGERTVYHEGTLEKFADYIERSFREMGYEVKRQPVVIGNDDGFGSASGKIVYNLQVMKRGQILMRRL